MNANADRPSSAGTARASEPDRGKPREIIYWGKPLDWHNQTLTPNPDTLYFMGFYDTNSSGPMVVEIPPAGDDGSLNGNFVTLWQTALEDAGKLGVDKERRPRRRPTSATAKV